MRKAPYEEFLRGCKGAVLCLTTLGAEVDRKLKRLARTDMTAAVLYDACASAALEARADEYEACFGTPRTYRFCPGYGGSELSDVRHIYAALRGERIGVTVGADCYMLPSKSMAGIIGLGKAAVKRCGDCILRAHCGYLRENRLCYDAGGDARETEDGREKHCCDSGKN